MTVSFAGLRKSDTSSGERNLTRELPFGQHHGYPSFSRRYSKSFAQRTALRAEFGLSLPLLTRNCCAELTASIWPTCAESSLRGQHVQPYFKILIRDDVGVRQQFKLLSCVGNLAKLQVVLRGFRFGAVTATVHYELCRPFEIFGQGMPRTVAIICTSLSSRFSGGDT